MARLDTLLGKVAVPSETSHPLWEAVKHEVLPIPCTREPGFINRFVNRRIKYERDIEHKTRQRDFWKPPALTWHERRGDCEDYALVKRALWLANGGSEEDLRLLIVWDYQTRDWHATLLVHHENTWLNLDIGRNEVFPAESFRGIYRPHMVLTGDRAWKFETRKG